MERHCTVPRRGVTVPEVLVVISVVALLTAIVLPAIVELRETSRRTVCGNNLRQIGTAMDQYVATFRKYVKTGRRGLAVAYLFPFLNQEAAYQTYVNNSRPWTREEASHIPRIPVLQCPADINSSRPLGISYGENRGHASGENEKIRLHPWPRHNGVIHSFLDEFVLTPGLVRDGCSNTAAFAEMLTFPRAGRTMYVEKPYDFARCGSAILLRTHCLERANGRVGQPRGVNWTWRTLSNAGYVHLLPPNGKQCVFQPCAGSDHKGGCYTLYLDGSVRWTSNDVDSNIWQETGTYDGAAQF